MTQERKNPITVVDGIRGVLDAEDRKVRKLQGDAAEKFQDAQEALEERDEEYLASAEGAEFSVDESVDDDLDDDNQYLPADAKKHRHKKPTTQTASKSAALAQLNREDAARVKKQQELDLKDPLVKLMVVLIVKRRQKIAKQKHVQEQKEARIGASKSKGNGESLKQKKEPSRLLKMFVAVRRAIGLNKPEAQKGEKEQDERIKQGAEKAAEERTKRTNAEESTVVKSQRKAVDAGNVLADAAMDKIASEQRYAAAMRAAGSYDVLATTQRAISDAMQSLPPEQQQRAMAAITEIEQILHPPAAADPQGSMLSSGFKSSSSADAASDREALKSVFADVNLSSSEREEVRRSQDKPMQSILMLFGLPREMAEYIVNTITPETRALDHHNVRHEAPESKMDRNNLPQGERVVATDEARTHAKESQKSEHSHASSRLSSSFVGRLAEHSQGATSHTR